MSSLYNLVKVKTNTTGSGIIDLGNPVSGFLSFSTGGVLDGDTVSYGIIDSTNSEVGKGFYSASGSTLTRSVINSTNNNNPISLSGDATVFITALADDFRRTIQVTVDFGFSSGNEGDTAIVTVPCSWVKSDSIILCNASGGSTLDHSGEDAMIEDIQGFATNIVEGVSFDIVAYAPLGTWGRYNINAIL